MNKKSKVKRQKNFSSANPIEHKPECVVDKLANRELCLAALQVLPPLVTSASTLFKPKFHQVITMLNVKLDLATVFIYHIISAIPLVYCFEQQDCKTFHKG